MDIIDRDMETKKILASVNASTMTEVLVLCAESGIGKSTLAKKIKLSNELKRELLILKAPIEFKDKEGDYIWNFFKTLYDKNNKRAFWFQKESHFQTYGYFINKFYKKYRNKSLKETINELPVSLSVLGLLKIIKTILDFLITPFVSVFNSYNVPQYNKDNISQYIGYITYIIKQKRILIILDNIQNIDIMSRKYLFQCISCLNKKNTYFIMEYTLSKENPILLADLRETFEQYDIKYTFYTIDKLYIDDAYATVKVLKPDSVDESVFQLEISKYYCNISNGNLKDLFAYAISYQKPKQFNDGIKNQLMNLKDESAIYIFIVLSLNNGQISKKLLMDIFKRSSFNLFLDIKHGIDILNEEQLLEELEDTYYISHTSTIRKFKELENTSVFAKYTFSILQELKSYYEKIYNDKNFLLISDYECFLSLIQIYAKIEPIKIYSSIDDLERYAGNLLTPKHALRYYELVLDYLYDKRKDFTSIYYRAFRFCCGLELYDEAYKILISIRDVNYDSYEYQIYYALILYLSGRYDDSLSFIELQVFNDDRINLYYHILKMLNYRMLNQNDKCLKIAQMIENQKIKYRKYKEYAYFLCLADLYKPKKDAVNDLFEGINLFENTYNCSAEANRFKISLSYVYASLYKPKKALSILQKSQQSIGNQVLYKAIFLNNYSAFSLLMHNYGQEISDNLNNAEDYTYDTFSKLVILNNHLIWCMERGQNEMGNFICKNIIKLLEKESEKQLISLASYNLYLFFEQQKQKDLSKNYYQKALELVTYSCNLRWRFSCHGPLTKEQLRIMSNPWNVCFLTRWEITYLPE